MSAIRKICQNMYTNDVSLPTLNSFELKNAITSLFPENVQPNIASLYLDSLGLILTF